MLADFAASPPHEQEVPDFDDARDNSSPINMHETSSYDALLNSADPMLKTSQSDLITDDSNLIKPNLLLLSLLTLNLLTLHLLTLHLLTLHLLKLHMLKLRILKANLLTLHLPKLHLLT